MADGVEAAPPVCSGRHLDRVLTALQSQADADGELDWRVSVDSTVARVHQHAATAGRPAASSGRSSARLLSHTVGSVE